MKGGELTRALAQAKALPQAHDTRRLLSQIVFLSTGSWASAASTLTKASA